LAYEGGGLEAEILEFGHNAIEFTHILVPDEAVLRVFGRQLGGDRLAGDLAGPHVVGSMEDGWVGLASTARLSTVRHTRCDTSSQHQAEIRQLGQQCAVTLFETAQ
jgi:hypothetical protein